MSALATHEGLYEAHSQCPSAFQETQDTLVRWASTLLRLHQKYDRTHGANPQILISNGMDAGVGLLQAFNLVPVTRLAEVSRSLVSLRLGTGAETGTSCWKSPRVGK
jgi:hypothetical protein